MQIMDIPTANKANCDPVGIVDILGHRAHPFSRRGELTAFSRRS
jgi:hypothetical protein